MNMVIPNEGKELWLYWALVTDGSDLEDFVLDLFQNDYTPDDDSTDSSFTVATFGGYAQLDLLRSEFSTPSIVSDVAESERAPAPEWTQTSGSAQTVYGWYLRGADSGIVLAAQRFDSPRTMATGATQVIDPCKLKLKTLS